MFGLAALAVADVLYLGVRERDAGLAVLRAGGWPGPALSRLIVSEGVGIGLLGALTGALLEMAATVALAGEPAAGVVLGALLAVAGAVGLTALASAVPALVAQRLPVARILARE